MHLFVDITVINDKCEDGVYLCVCFEICAP